MKILRIGSVCCFHGTFTTNITLCLWTNVSQLTIQQNKLQYNAEWTKPPRFSPPFRRLQKLRLPSEDEELKLQSPEARSSLATNFTALKQRSVLTVKTGFLPTWGFVQNLFLRTSGSAWMLTLLTTSFTHFPFITLNDRSSPLELQLC